MGMLADPLATFGTLLSESAAWQAWTATGTPAAALAHIHRDVSDEALPRAVIGNAARSARKEFANPAIPFFGRDNTIRVYFEAAAGFGPAQTAATERAGYEAFRAALDPVLADIFAFVGDCFEVEAVTTQGTVVLGGDEETDGAATADRTFLQVIDVRWRDD